MIVTSKKTNEEILAALGDAKTAFIAGCGSCAYKCSNSDEKSVLAVKDFLEQNGITVLGAANIDSACDMRLVKRDLLRNENFKNADAVLVLSCGAGVQSIESASQKVVIPALNSSYIGTTEKIGVYKKFCSACGTCVLGLTGGICPKTRCAKSLVNGPCGGFVNGKCETDQNKDCAWVLIYEKLKKTGKLQQFLTFYCEPKK
ncbi:MAG: methylenetetrahydrofolate reductase C-terminal domain-containing protein [Endomicrobium sp.]|jgi:hypothetical protein|nr:methylenetetrahydrofolate reductase C-terminal domain-containing protein [Endomicrobium sp.]